MEPVGGRYCINPTLAQEPMPGGTLDVPAWYPADNLASRPTYPRMGDQAVPAGQIDALSREGGIQNAQAPGATPRALYGRDRRRAGSHDRRRQGCARLPALHPRAP